MIEGLPWPAWLGVAGTGWALVALCVIALIRGRLVPRSAIEDERHDANEWRTESRIKDQQILELAEQNRAMLKAFGPTLTDFLQGLRRAGVDAKDGENT